MDIGVAKGGAVDPVALIVAALAAGAGLAVQGGTSDAVKSAYARLRDAVSQRLADHPDGEQVLARHEANPRTGQAPLARELAHAGAGEDLDLAARALALMELIDRAGGYAVSVSGSRGVQVGDHTTQVNNYFIQERSGRRQAGAADGTPAGRPLGEVTDPFVLEVHRPVQADDPPSGLSALPVYVPREHDGQLAEVVRAAAEGTSGIAVLVGESSTGKTRACWEALLPLRERLEGWRLWHPIDPTRPEAALRELSSIGRRTVIWLNEAQFYLDATDGGLGERVAAGLRELLRDPDRAPVLVLATLWPQFWGALTDRPSAGADPHAQARELLAGRDISVPIAFTADQLRQLPAAEDPRLDRAAKAAEDGRVIQFLAGAPELMARYRNAPPAAAALISAAMDARRLGMGVVLPLTFLEAAAPGYLADADWDGLPENWLEQALAYTAAPSKGIRGPLARVRPRDGADPFPGPVCRLADYLDQHGRSARRRQLPPASFWAAAARFARPADLPDLARAAGDRGLLRDAARLRKHAAGLGDPVQAAVLLRRWHSLNPRPAGPAAAQWAVDRVLLDDPRGVALVMDALRDGGAAEQAAALLARDPASHVSLDDAGGVAWLLGVFRRTGAAEQAATLLARDPASHVSLDDPRGVIRLLGILRRAGSAGQTAVLARRTAAHTPIDTTGALAGLLRALHDAGAAEQADALGRRAAARIPLENPGDVGRMLADLRWRWSAEMAAALVTSDPAARVTLHEAGDIVLLLNALSSIKATGQADALTRRAVAEFPLDNPGGVAQLLGALQTADRAEQAAALLARDPASHVSLRDAGGIAYLIDVLLRARATEQAAALLARDPASRVSLDDLWGVIELLRALRKAGAAKQGAALARRAATRTPLDSPEGIARLLDALREAGAAEQAAELAHRAADAAVDDPDGVTRLLYALRAQGATGQAFALADRAAAHVFPDEVAGVISLVNALQGMGMAGQAAAVAHSAATRTPLHKPHIVAYLLRALQEAGAEEQTAALARRAATSTPLHNPNHVAELLAVLHEAGAEEQTAALARRAATSTPLHAPGGVARLLDAMQRAGATEQAAALLARDPASRVSLHDPRDAAHLLGALRTAGAVEQVKSLTDRLPAEGYFDLYREQADHQQRYSFGREPDGNPAPPWNWDDLD